LLKGFVKIKKETIFKAIAAVVIPGGFIVWGIYELNRLRKTISRRGGSKAATQDSSETGT
jgi:hypothetical protein